jgi:excisionase family DNA binding protein
MTLISIAKAAEILGIARATAYRLAREGRLPCVRSLGPLRIHLEKLNELIDAEAAASMTTAAETNPAANLVHPKPQAQFSRQSQAAMQRELDELLRSTKSKGNRTR